jgi:hypothetical protein
MCIKKPPPPPTLSAPRIAFADTCVDSSGWFIDFTDVPGATGYDWEIDSVVTGNFSQSLGVYDSGSVNASDVALSSKPGSECSDGDYSEITTGPLIGDWFVVRVRATTATEVGPWSSDARWFIFTTPPGEPSCGGIFVCGL